MLGKRSPQIPVYLITGFMDSGKTKFIKETLAENDFGKKTKILILMCEDGIEEYDAEELKAKYSASFVEIEKEEDFTLSRLNEIDKQYLPDLIFIEYNGTWKFQTIGDEDCIPSNWEIVQIMSTVDGTTFENYMQNMRTMILEQLFLSDLIIINRCDENTPKSKFRQAIKGFNKQVQIVYEGKDGSIDNGNEGVPFDISGDSFTVPESDYCLWFVDMHDHPGSYIGKTATFLANIYPITKKGEPFLMIGRHAMTCCADDVQFLAMKCFCEESIVKNTEKKSWANITGKIGFSYDPDIKEEVPCLELISMEQVDEPEDKLVYFS